ncbi:MAG: glycosyltransferase [candidate division Zixibacteria bacterium]|nr:glycosyltransferase [candidate division Zixibacteria bacterium]
MRNKIIILGDSVSVHIIRWAKGIAECGFKVTVISNGGKEIEGIETILLGNQAGTRLGYIGLLPTVRHLIRKIAPNLVHSHYAIGYGLWGRCCGWRPFLISVWGSDIVEFPSNGLKRWGLRKILLSADYITATSEFLKQRTIRVAPEISSKIGIIPFGVEIPLIPTSSPSDKVRIIFLKTHRRKYGPDILLKAMYIVSAQNSNIMLTMAGEGEMTEGLQRMAREYQLEDSVKFVGFIDNAEVPKLLAEHDIMVMPSLAESFGVAALEASASGLPVIASNVGGIPEIVRDNITGILVPPSDAKSLAEAIVRLSHDVELRKRMGMAGREYVGGKYRWQENVRQMVQLYEKLIANKGI